MLSTITFIIVLSVLIFIHELGHFFIAKKNGVKVETFSLGFGKKIFGFRRKGTEYRISAIPLGGYVKLSGETPYEGGTKGASGEFMSKPVSSRAMVLAAGPVANYLFGFVLFAAIFIMGSPQVTSRIGGLMDEYPAKEAGLKEGDRIIELDGNKVVYWEDVLGVVRKKTEGALTLKVKRNEQEIFFDVVPKVREFKNIFGQQVKVGLLGIIPSQETKYVKHHPFKAVRLAAVKTWNITWMTYFSLWRMVTGAMSFRESVAGPIGIFMVTAKAAYAGFMYVLGLMAVLSISLAIFNLLPIPVLDGGHILFLMLEKIRGRVVSEKIYERANQLGIAFLVTLMVFVFYNDAVRAGLFDKMRNFICPSSAEKQGRFLSAASK